MLALAASQALSGGAHAVLLSGEAGIGKTTLVAVFARDHCLPSGWNVLYGRCNETVAAPFEPFRGLLRPSCRRPCRRPA